MNSTNVEWPAALATLATLGVLASPTTWIVPHAMTATTILVGEFTLLSTGYVLYRRTVRKPTSRKPYVGATLGGLWFVASPFVFGATAPRVVVPAVVGGGAVAALMAFELVRAGGSEDRLSAGRTRPAVSSSS